MNSLNVFDWANGVGYSPLQETSEAGIPGYVRMRESYQEQPWFEDLMIKAARLIEGRHWDSGKTLRHDDWVAMMGHLSDGSVDFANVIGLKEAVGIDNFTYLFPNVLERELLAAWDIQEAGLERILTQRAVTNFQTVDAYDVEFLRGPLQELGEKQQVKADNTITDTRVQWHLVNHEKAFEFSWQAYLRDDLGIFGQTARRLVDACNNLKAIKITKLLVNASGPIDASFFNTTTTTTSALSIESIAAGITAMLEQTVDVVNGSYPIDAMPMYLMVPPRLWLDAVKYVNSRQVMYAVTKDTAIQLPTDNTLNPAPLTVIKNPWLPLINTTSGNTNWFLFADPNKLNFGEFGVLRGQEAPVLYQQAPTAMRVGGGMSDWSFANNTRGYKVQYPCQATVVRTQAGYASTGAGG